MSYIANKATINSMLRVTSPAFPEGADIPVKYTCDGRNISPPLEIRGLPPATVCLAIIMDDPDAPIATWAHWLVWNIPVKHHIKEHYIADMQGTNDFGGISYNGPCPPKNTRHHYYFSVFALNRQLDLQLGANRSELEAAMSGHILATGQLMAGYTRH